MREKDTLTLSRSDLASAKVNIGGRDILVGFNEPAFRFSDSTLSEGDLDSKLNARLVSYFLPAVEIARRQKRRPRYFALKERYRETYSLEPDF